MSGDGATVVTGTPTHNGVGQGTIAIGLVEVFRVQAGGEWAQLGQGLTDNIGFGMYGYFVSVSSNGDIIATGTSHAGDGKVDVYQLKSAYDCWLLSSMQYGEDLTIFCGRGSYDGKVGVKMKMQINTSKHFEEIIYKRCSPSNPDLHLSVPICV